MFSRWPLSSFVPPRRQTFAFVYYIANRRFFFTVTALAVLSAKVSHIYSHFSSLPPHQIQKWGFSLFTQDVALLILTRLLLEYRANTPASKLRSAVGAFTGFLIIFNVLLGIVGVSFVIVTGSEVHWRNIAFATDASSWVILLSGIVSFIIVICLNFIFGWLLQDFCYSLFGYAADVASWPFAFIWRKLGHTLPQTQYARIPQKDVERVSKYESNEADEGYFQDDQRSSGTSTQPQPLPPPLPIQLMQRVIEKAGVRVSTTKIQSILNILAYALTTAALLVLLGFDIARPHDGSLTFLSWTVPLLPFVDFSSASPTLGGLRPVFGSGIQKSWDFRTALKEAPPFPWLPKDHELPGFEDWYRKKRHYNAAADPMKISNLAQPLLPEIRDKLKNVPVKHVMLFLLESTRNDIFPIKKDGLIWDRLAGTWPDNEIPKEAQERLANLTRTANYITGDYDDGFPHNDTSQPKRGGAHFTNAHTTGTYTLKSLTGTLCGISPLVADFNLEYKHHVYQPCLPHIFDALNSLDQPPNEGTRKPYASSAWKSYYYQASTLEYDYHHQLMNLIGFKDENMIHKEYLTNETARHGPVKLPLINAFAFEEDPLEEYFRDAFKSAKEEDERVFLTHITTTSHHAFKMPKNETYIPMAEGIEDLSHYVNAEGYDDKWIQKVLNVLDEQGVANETLIIFLGDHGLSMPENDITSPYYNPSIGIDHVPLVLSHPLLPAFDVHDAVHATQVLPTILDVLLETDGLDGARRQAAADLMRNYEGQSLIRPTQAFNDETGQGNWQITVVNPGRAVLTVRDARYPERHLVVPVIDNVEWRFSNITEDPREQDAVQRFDFGSFLMEIEIKHGKDVALWAEEGAFMTRWWVEENTKRWRFGSYAERP